MTELADVHDSKSCGGNPMGVRLSPAAPMRFIYRHPKIYGFLISFIHSRALLEQFKKEVGRNHSIFDVAAGYGGMAEFIDSPNSYCGIDANEKFVEHGRRQGLNLKIKNIFDETAYQKSDIFLAVDIIHHLPEEKLSELFDLIFKHAGQKVIVLEPAFVSVTYRYWIFGRFLGWFFRKFDADGVNDIQRWFSENEYEDLFKRRIGSDLGKAFSVRYRRLGCYWLAVFENLAVR